MGSNKSQIDDNALYIEENEKAENYIQSGDFSSAAKVLVGIVEKDPKNWRAYNNMGIISWEKESWEDAFTTFKHSCEIKPDYTDAVINFFDASLKLKRINEALPVFKQALQAAPDNEEIKVITESIESQGDEIYSSERALRIGVYNPRVDEAKQLLEDGQLNSAMEKFLQINDEEGPNAGVYCGLGIISYYQKRYKDAFSLIYESIKLNPIDPDTFLNLIDAGKECDLIEEARKIYEIYCSDFPSLKKIKKEFEDIAKEKRRVKKKLK
jgi:tetratricopeptide (TPR) repeat protein